MNKAFFDRLDNIKMSFADSLIYANYAKKQHYYYDYISNADLIRINKPDIIEMTRVLYDLEHNNILSLAKKYLADSLLVKQFENDLIF